MYFNRTAIYVFFVLVNASRNSAVTILTVANFTLNGNNPVQFRHVPDPAGAMYEFNQLVFQQTSLLNTQHTLIISISGDADAYVNFDYAIYTHDGGDTAALPSTAISNITPLPTTATPDPTSDFFIANIQMSTGTIIGAAVAVIAIVFLIVLPIFRVKHKQQSRDKKAEEEEVIRIRPFATVARTTRPQANIVRTPHIHRPAAAHPMWTIQTGSGTDESNGHEIGLHPLKDQVAVNSAYKLRPVFQGQRLQDDSPPISASYTDDQKTIHYT